jgi:hypothetical protein
MPRILSNTSTKLSLSHAHDWAALPWRAGVIWACRSGVPYRRSRSHCLQRTLKKALKSLPRASLAGIATVGDPAEALGCDRDSTDGLNPTNEMIPRQAGNLDVYERSFDRQVRSRRGMTDLGNVELRRLALKVLARHAGSDGGAKAVAAAALRTYDDLARVSAPLIGQVGVAALTGRALHLAQREYPWLAQTREPAPADGSFAQVIFCLEGQDPAVATEAAGALFAIFAGLLVTFIGETLTAGLLRKAWPDAFSDARTEET